MIKEEYKKTLQNLTLRTWLSIEEQLVDVSEENRLKRMYEVIIGQTNPTVGQISECLKSCIWLTQQSTYIHQPIQTIELNGERFKVIKDLNDMTVSQYLSYETHLKSLKNKDVYTSVNLCITLLNKDNESWDLNDSEFERRTELMLDCSVLNFLNIVPFYQTHLNNSNQDTPSYLQNVLMGHEDYLKEKKNLTRIGDLWVLFYHWRMMIYLKCVKYFYKKLG